MESGAPAPGAQDAEDADLARAIAESMAAPASGAQDAEDADLERAIAESMMAPAPGPLRRHSSASSSASYNMVPDHKEGADGDFVLL